jgi:hypothetical protein
MSSILARALLLPLLTLAALAVPAWCAHAADMPAVPAAFEKLVPRAFPDGLRLVELRRRCTDCPSWRIVDVVPDEPSGPVRKEKVSVVDGVTAMYGYPGSGFFANAKIEKSAPASYERDKGVVVEALEHIYVRSRKGAESYLKASPPT